VLRCGLVARISYAVPSRPPPLRRTVRDRTAPSAASLTGPLLPRDELERPNGREAPRQG
jgi:hypothetical protein